MTPVESPAQTSIDAVRIEAERPGDAAAVDALVLRAFGPGRFAKTAERIREAAGCAAGFTARRDGVLIGSVRLWSITVGDARALFLGPIAVERGDRNGGLGAALVAACVDHARAAGVDGVLLVGDPPYFARFGFQPAPQAALSGPVDRRRLMWLPLGRDEATGVVRPA